MSGYVPGRNLSPTQTFGGYQNYSHINSGWVTDVDVDTDAASDYSTDLDSGFEPNAKIGLPQRIRTIFTESVYTDVHFEMNCGQRPKPTLKAHRAVLAVGSPVFAEIFLKQKAEGVEKDIIQINNHPFYAFKAVVEYLYTDEIFFERGKDAEIMAIMNAAKDFGVPTLEARCLSNLQSSDITGSNVITRLKLANTHKLEQYKQQCLQFIQDNTAAVLCSPEFQSCNASSMKTICKLPKLNLQSELQLLEGVMRWANAQPTNPNRTLKQIVDPFLRSIRFLSMSRQDFSRVVESYPDLFSKDDVIKIFMYQSTKQSEHAPSWCSKGENRCSTVIAGTQKQISRPLLPTPDPDQKMSFPLRPVKGGQASNLTCLLSLKCTSGNYRIKALKLTFGTPFTEASVIERLVIKVESTPNNFHFTENITIRKSAHVLVPFSRPLLAFAGNTINIEAEASEIRNYNFLQFDEQKFNQEGFPFETALSSRPKGKRLFFISEVVYHVLQPRPRGQGREPRWC